MTFKKGEVEFYKKHDPNEMKQLYDHLSKQQSQIEKFLKEYTYNYVKKLWRKKK